MDTYGRPKSTSYWQTFRSRQRLLALPMILGTLVAGLLVVGAPKAYLSQASLWVDTAAPAPSSLSGTGSASAPSQQEQAVLTELLTTRAFRVGVAQRSARLTAQASGHPTLPANALNPFVPGNVNSTTPGSQVLEITYTGTSPQLAQNTVTAILDELRQDGISFSEAHDSSALAYYRQQAKAASQGVAAAQTQVANYLRQHPGSPPSDPGLSALTTAASTASAQLAQDNLNLTQATSDSTAGGFSVKLVDAPSAGIVQTSKKKQLEGIIAGLFAGALISFLGVIALTPGKREHWEDELPDDIVEDPNTAGAALFADRLRNTSETVLANAGRIVVNAGSNGGPPAEELAGDDPVGESEQPTAERSMSPLRPTARRWRRRTSPTISTANVGTDEQPHTNGAGPETR